MTIVIFHYRTAKRHRTQPLARQRLRICLLAPSITTQQGEAGGCIPAVLAAHAALLARSASGDPRHAPAICGSLRICRLRLDEHLALEAAPHCRSAVLPGITIDVVGPCTTNVPPVLVG